MSDESPIRLYQAFVGQDPASAIKVIEQVRSSGVQQAALFDTVFAPALALLGAAWATGELDEVTFTQAAVVAEQIGSFVTPSSAAADTGVTVLIGCMQKDHHAVMKNIVAAALKEAGNRVVDLGIDCRPAEFLEKVEETSARIVIVCAEIMQTARAASRVREMIATAGHDDVFILVAGGPFDADPDLAKAAGANGIIHGAEGAIKLVGRIAAEKLGAQGSVSA